MAHSLFYSGVISSPFRFSFLALFSTSGLPLLLPPSSVLNLPRFFMSLSTLTTGLLWGARCSFQKVIAFLPPCPFSPHLSLHTLSKKVFYRSTTAVRCSATSSLVSSHSYFNFFSLSRSLPGPYPYSTISYTFQLHSLYDFSRIMSPERHSNSDPPSSPTHLPSNQCFMGFTRLHVKHRYMRPCPCILMTPCNILKISFGPMSEIFS